MKRRTFRLKFLTPALAAAVLSLPVIAETPPPTLEQQQREQQQVQRQQGQREVTEANPETDQNRTLLGNERGNGQTTEPQQPADAQAADRQWRETPSRDSEIQTRKAYSTGQVGSQAHMPYLGRINKASELMGFDVKGLNGEEIGEVSDLVVDLGSGRLVLAVLEVGGILGIGADEVAVPPAELSPDMGPKSSDGGARSLRIAHTKLETTQPFDAAQQLNEQSIAQVYETYGADYRGSGQYATTDGVDQRSELATERRSDPAREQITTETESDRQLVRGQDDASSRSVGKPAQYQLASRLIGMEVVGNSGEEIGEVEEIGVDMANGRLTTLIVSSGGFLGIGDKLSAIPPSAFQWDEGQKVLRLNATREQLMSAPQFGQNEWPANDYTYVGQSYRAFNVDPYFHQDSERSRTDNTEVESSGGTDADNTRRNQQDRDSQSVTPLDQGNNDADLQTTAQIRRALMDHEDLSFNARNVKIITENGKVTLRGPVNSEEERMAVQRIAEELHGGEQLENLLEVRSAGDQ